jgi:hypothetical protein
LYKESLYLTITIILITNVFCIAQTSKKVQDISSEIYASWEYHDGDIILELFDNGHFVLEIKKWDSDLLLHTKIDSSEGNWENKSGDTLILTDENDIRIIYERIQVEMRVGGEKKSVDSWSWISSSEPLKLDGVNLSNKKVTDAFFLNLFKDEIDQLNKINDSNHNK